MKQLIVTADDFGLCPEVNAAVIQAHTQGILTSASLMISAKSAEEASHLAKTHSTLKVGLHLVLVEGFSVLTKDEIPDLVDAQQRFSNKIFASGFRYFFSEKLKNQIVKECETQIKKFLETGLKMDHLDSHNHLHIHPIILEIIVRLAKKYSIPAIRVPWQSWHLLRPKQTPMAILMAPWVARMRQKLRTANILFNDEVFGLFETGSMVEETWLKMIPKINEGITEIYCHPATKTVGVLKETMPSYKHAAELQALLSPAVRKKLEQLKIRTTSYGALQ